MTKIWSLVSCHILIIFLNTSASCASVDYSSDPYVQLFQQYLRINTTTTISDLTPAVQFWQDLASSQDLELQKHEYVAGYPVLVIKWPGVDPSLPSIVLNSHMDVVPVNEAEWKYPPFAATLDSDGVIWGRGTQDMKSVSIQYFLAMKELKQNNVTLLRDVYMTLMPDEEVGSVSGLRLFKESREFAALNVGCVMDEGAAAPLPVYGMFYQDKAIWQIEVTCYGEAGHSATFPASNTTATGKCRYVIDKFLNYRDQQHAISETATLLKSGLFTAINLNKIRAGTANNVVPQSVSLVFDIRLATELNTTAFELQMNSWLAEAGSGINMTFLQKNKQSARTVVSKKNPYYAAIQSAASNLGITIVPIVSPGSTDARHLRLQDVPAFGFSPLANTPTLLHTDNERLNVTTFLNGIEIYKEMITSLANIPASKTNKLDVQSLVVQSEFN
ncbi:hypothetical protein JYU34_008627 [Plutella xylostella]|uniref:N-acyl-aliphatic-L-amino acid amidohydrolase n=1 Tax=Plutella xylostella TaxID=51655 RepID=A0ABQ7QLI6_PLUXY|nr:hypothetical protein JYU34_008627 [Plutella xylostella]